MSARVLVSLFTAIMAMPAIAGGLPATYTDDVRAGLVPQYLNRPLPTSVDPDVAQVRALFPRSTTPAAWPVPPSPPVRAFDGRVALGMTLSLTEWLHTLQRLYGLSLDIPASPALARRVSLRASPATVDGLIEALDRLSPDVALVYYPAAGHVAAYLSESSR